MKTAVSRLLIVIVLIIAGSAPAIGVAYQVKRLGTPFGMTGGYATDINNKSQIVGAAIYSEQPGGLYDTTYPLLWNTSNNEPIMLGSIPGVDSIWASGINGLGQVTINSSIRGNPGSPTAYLWSSETGMQYVGSGFVQKLNQLGKIAGAYFVPPMFGIACIWNPDGSYTDLGVLPGRDRSEATDINENGVAVGHSYDMAITGMDVYQEACLWTPTEGIVALENLGSNSYAGAVNNSNQIVGYSQIANLPWESGTHAILWDPDRSLTDLGPTLIGVEMNQRNYATDINDLGQIIGYAYESSDLLTHHAVFWNSEHEATVLDELPGDIRSKASGINNLGQIVGYSMNPAWEWSPVIWEPVPEPSGFATLIVSFASLLSFFRKQKK